MGIVDQIAVEERRFDFHLDALMIEADRLQSEHMRLCDLLVSKEREIARLTEERAFDERLIKVLCRLIREKRQ